MQAIAVTQAVALTPATVNSKDDSNSMAAHRPQQKEHHQQQE